MTSSWRLVPSMGALRAFIAVARNASFSRAGDELNLTQGAISRQIKALEEQLGVVLFLRGPGAVRLTEAGQTYLPGISTAIDQIAANTLELMANNGEGASFTIAIPPTFGQRWLIPRLPEFYAQNPQIMINILTRSDRVDLAREHVHLAIQFGETGDIGFEHMPLMRETVVAVCSPELANLTGDLDAIARLPLLHLTSRPYAWRDWFTALNRPDLSPGVGLTFEQFSLVAQAAIAGIGAALLPAFLFEEELTSGKLVRLPGPAVASRASYQIIWSNNLNQSRKMRLFIEWLIAKARTQDAQVAG